MASNSEADDNGPPLTVKQRMALLQQAANTSTPSTSSPTPKLTSPGPIVNLGTSAAQDSLASALGDDDHLSLPRPASAASLVQPMSQADAQAGAAKDPLAAYQPLSPTLSPLPSRTSSPSPSAASAAGRARAFSTASAGSTSSTRAGGMTRTQALAGSASGMGLLPTGGRTRSGSASSTAAPELTKLSIAGTVAKQEHDPLMAFSPLTGRGEGVSKDGEGGWTVAPGSVWPSATDSGSKGSTAVASLQAVPGPGGVMSPPRLPPRRNTITDSDIPMTRTGSNNSLSTSAAPALPPRPRGAPLPASTLPPSLPSTTAGAPPALPARSRTLGLGPLGSSTSSLNSSVRSPAATPPRRHLRPIPGSEFESVDLGQPAPSSPTFSLSAASLASSFNSSAPAAAGLRPPSLVRAGSYASSEASGSGTPPQSPITPRAPSNGTTALARRPIDPRARRRYEVLFDEALFKNHEAGGRSNGKGEAALDREDRLDGLVVRRIWLRSRLEGAFLHAVWDACDGEGRGSVGREAFCAGMWAIDEELRRRAG